ncbi:MAG: restriction endonuclease subunit S, partial [Verrucomicrobia bacterium]|nr:restriction endonuclease subunit S [Verrucomicrobiota bacterium]
MSPQDFLAHFHEIANAPGGVARLREVTYSLAVRGHLISNDPAESALPLGTTILSAGSRPIADNEKHLDDVPPNWTWARFEWLGEIFGGQTPSMSKSEFWGGDIPWVSPKDMRAKV